MGQVDNLVGDSLGIGKGWDILSDTSEAELDVLGLGSRQLSLALLTEDDELISIGLLGELTADVAGQAGMDTTAEALVGGADDNESLLVLALERLGLGLVEDLLGSLTVDLGLVHGALGTGQLGRGHDLHGVGDLLDVADGLETALDFAQRRKAGGSMRGGRDGAVWLTRDVSWLVLDPFFHRARRLLHRPSQGNPSSGTVHARRVRGGRPSRVAVHLPASNTYREGIAAPALRAGRAARDSILSCGDLKMNALPTVAQLSSDNRSTN